MQTHQNEELDNVSVKNKKLFSPRPLSYPAAIPIPARCRRSSDLPSTINQSHQNQSCSLQSRVCWIIDWIEPGICKAINTIFFWGLSIFYFIRCRRRCRGHGERSVVPSYGSGTKGPPPSSHKSGSSRYITGSEEALVLLGVHMATDGGGRKELRHDHGGGRGGSRMVLTSTIIK
jgi:hypothetical protein